MITRQQAAIRAQIYIEHARQLRLRGLSGEKALNTALRMLAYGSYR